MSRSRGIPDLIHTKNDVIWAWTGREATGHGDRRGTGRRGSASGPAPCRLGGMLLRRFHRNRFLLLRSEAQVAVMGRGFSARAGGSREPSRSDGGSPHRTGAASPEPDPPRSLFYQEPDPPRNLQQGSRHIHRQRDDESRDQIHTSFVTVVLCCSCLDLHSSAKLLLNIYGLFIK